MFEFCEFCVRLWSKQNIWTFFQFCGFCEFCDRLWSKQNILNQFRIYEWTNHQHFQPQVEWFLRSDVRSEYQMKIRLLTILLFQRSSENVSSEIATSACFSSACSCTAALSSSIYNSSLLSIFHHKHRCHQFSTNLLCPFLLLLCLPVWALQLQNCVKNALKIHATFEIEIDITSY